MKSPFQLQIDFANDCNWIYAFTVKLKIRKHIRLNTRNSIQESEQSTQKQSKRYKVYKYLKGI